MDYIELLKQRAKESRVYSPHQMTGLMLSEILHDKSHKSLYMRLAKKYDNDELLKLAKNIAEKTDIKNRGAYFMSIIKEKAARKPK